MKKRSSLCDVSFAAICVTSSGDIQNYTPFKLPAQVTCYHRLSVKYRLSVQQRRLPNRNFVLSKYSLFACACCMFCTVKSNILKDMSRIGLSWIRSYKNKMKYIDNRTGLKHSCPPVYRQDVNVRILVSIAHHTFTADTFRRTNFVSSTA